MITESGRVVAVDSGCLWVETMRTSTCGSCSAQKGCGHGLLNRVGAGRRNYLRVLPGELPIADFAVDDRVRIAIPERVLVVGAVVVYLVPLLALLVGTVLGSRLGAGDAGAVAGALVGLLAGLGLVWLHGRISRNDTEMQPRVVSRTARADQNSTLIALTEPDGHFSP